MSSALNYGPTALAKAQVIGTLNFNKPELREKNPTIVSLASQNTNIAVPAPEIARVHENRVVEINYLTKKTSASGSAKVAFHTGTAGNSATTTLTYVTKTQSFFIELKKANNNVFDYMKLFQNEWNQSWALLLKDHDTAALTALLAARCQLSAANLATPLAANGLTGKWDETNYALALTDYASSLATSKSFMDSRYFGGAYDFIVDPQIKAKWEFYANQGAGNNANTNYLFGMDTIVPTQGLIDSDFSLGSFIIMPKGTLFGINWNDKANLTGFDGGKTETGTLTTALDPFGYGIKADVSMYTKRADTSSYDGAGGSTQDMVTYVEISVAMAYGTPPLSTVSDGVPTLVGIVP